MHIYIFCTLIRRLKVYFALNNYVSKNRCLGVSDWKTNIGTEDGAGDPGEGSGASGEEAWGTPSSGDLSDNLPDSEHGTLSVRDNKTVKHKN